MYTKINKKPIFFHTTNTRVYKKNHTKKQITIRKLTPPIMSRLTNARRPLNITKNRTQSITLTKHLTNSSTIQK